MTVKLEDQLRGAIRLKHFSYRTEETYVGWYRQFDSSRPLARLTPLGAA